VGGRRDADDAGRWLWNFVTAHARREALGASAAVESRGDGQAYGLRVQVGDRVAPPADQPPVELAASEVAEGRERLSWCAALAARVRELAREAAAEQGTRKSA
jgi:hypothetical protein